MPDGGLVEQQSKLSILVLEDMPNYGSNALAALKGHDARLVTTLEEAKGAMKERKFDFILSDAHVPISAGGDPTAVVSAILQACYDSGTPLCFVTKADHHGLLDKQEEGYITIRAVTLGDAAETYMQLSRSVKTRSEGDIFREMKSTAGENIPIGSKTPEVWLRALEMLRNASTKPSPIAGAIRKARSVGMDVVIENGLPKVIPLKNTKP